MDFPARFRKVFDAMQWTVDDVVELTGVTKSAVLQWLGQTSTPIQSMGSVKAAIKIERASGFSGIWLALGEGPERAPRTSMAHEVRSPVGSYAQNIAIDQPDERAPTWQDTTLDQFGEVLRQVPGAQREAVARLLDGWAREGGADHYRVALQAMLRPPYSKQQSRAG